MLHALRLGDTKEVIDTYNQELYKTVKVGYKAMPEEVIGCVAEPDRPTNACVWVVSEMMEGYNDNNGIEKDGEKAEEVPMLTNRSVAATAWKKFHSQSEPPSL